MTPHKTLPELYATLTHVADRRETGNCDDAEYYQSVSTLNWAIEMREQEYAADWEAWHAARPFPPETEEETARGLELADWFDERTANKVAFDAAMDVIEYAGGE